MYYIERNAVTDAMFLAGSVGEPATGETAWAAGTWAVGAEAIRPTLHRVFRCTVARTGSNLNPPEVDTASWADMRPTNRYLPFGPSVRADGKLVYQNRPLKSTVADIEYRLAQRYANAVAIFGLRGATWRVRVYSSPGGPLVFERSGRIKSAARGYWDYGYGQRLINDRVLVTGLPIYPNAEVRITIEAGEGQTRAVSQIEVGKLRFIPGVDLGGVEYGVVRSPKAFTSRKTEEDGSTSVLIYGTAYGMSGTVALSGKQEDSALQQLRNLIGRGAAYAPDLAPDYSQSLVFGVLESADVSRDASKATSARFDISGLPT